jgi:hypothetical protein
VKFTFFFDHVLLRHAEELVGFSPGFNLQNELDFVNFLKSFLDCFNLVFFSKKKMGSGSGTFLALFLGETKTLTQMHLFIKNLCYYNTGILFRKNIYSALLPLYSISSKFLGNFF